MGGCSSMSGVTTRVAPTSRACWRRTAEGSLTVMSEIPCARSTATSRLTGPAPVTSTRSSGPTSDSRNACRVMAIGSASAATLVGRESGNPDQAVGRHRLVLAEGAAVSDEVGRGTVQAHRRAAPSTWSTVPPHPGAGFPTTRSPGDQPEPLGAAATMPDHSWPRMAPGLAYRSRTMCRSEPQMPHSAISTSTSPVPAPDMAPARRLFCRRPHKRLPASVVMARGKD